MSCKIADIKSLSIFGYYVQNMKLCVINIPLIICIYTLLFDINNYTGQDPFGSHTLWQIFFIYAPGNNVNDCELVLEEGRYHMILVLQKCGLVLVNFMYSEFNILIF